MCRPHEVLTGEEDGRKEDMVEAETINMVEVKCERKRLKTRGTKLQKSPRAIKSGIYMLLPPFV